MMKKVLLLIFGLMLGGLTYGQGLSDTVYSSTRLVPRIGINVQKGYGVEVGLILNQFYTRFPRGPKTILPYASSGFFVSSELILSDFNKVLIGPKIGWELGVIGETYGGFFGVEFINYTDFDNYSPAVMIKIGIPFLWINVGYGYTMFIDDTLQSEIGNHRLTVTYTINRKAKKEYKRIRNNLDSR